MLRDATTGDLPYLRRVLDDPNNWDKLEHYSDDQIRDALSDPDQMIWIWGAQDGFAWMRRRDGVKIEEFAATRTGAGIGRAMFPAVLDRLAQVCPGPVWLYVAADNAGAIRFYERHGFARGPARPAVWHRRKGPVADALRMDLDAVT